jgi:hypothetical protein
MLRYLTSSDQHYGDACNTALPQGGTYWFRPDTQKPAVNCDSDDRNCPPRQQSNQVNYPSVTANTAPLSDSYPAQSQCGYSSQRGYPSQPYASSVNYAAPPYDFFAYLVSCPSAFLAEYSPNPLQIVPDSVYQGGQYPTQPSTPTRYDYPSSDLTSCQQSLYDPVGYFNTDGQCSSPLDSQPGHQHSLLSNTSGFLRYDDTCDIYDQVTQHPISSISPASSSSELGNALMEIPSPEPQSMSHSPIALPTLPTPPHSALKRELSESAIGMNPVKNVYGTSASGQSYSPMIPLPVDNPLLPGGHGPYPKEESHEQLHVGSSSMPRPPTPLHGYDLPHHGQQTQDSFRMVQDPAAYLVFAPAPKARSCLMYSSSPSYTHSYAAEASAFPVYTPCIFIFP